MLTLPIQALILDMDGVLWRGNQPLLDMPAFFSQVAALNIQVVFATNNGTRTIGMYLDRLAQLGVTVESWQVINSAIATAEYLAQRFPQGGAVYTVAERGVHEALTERGFTLLDDHTPPERDAEAIAVVAGMDHALNYDKLARATLLIRTGIPFIGTNPDRTFPLPHGLVPGAGAVLALLQAASGVDPTMIGKPEAYLYAFAMQRLNTPPARTLAVGDRLDTDILGGQRLGCQTCLVLSGVTPLADAALWQPSPDLILPSLADLLPLLEKV